MKQSVISAWHIFSEPLEGRVHHMYLDVLGLVTAGVGNLADPVSLALQMPWMKDGSPANPDLVRRDWTALKAMQHLKSRHYRYAAPVTSVRLTDEGIDSMVRDRLKSNERILKKTFPAWDEFPADAQLGICSMAWAMGAGFPAKFPRFTAAAKAQKWLEAMTACKIREGTPGQPDWNPGVVPRNKANRLCFANAETVRLGGTDPESLHWPNEAPAVVVMPMLRRGSPHRDAVERWQSILRDTYSDVRVDGIFGPKTEAATRSWQLANGLKADGIVGPLTWRAAEEHGELQSLSSLGEEDDEPTNPESPGAKNT